MTGPCSLGPTPSILDIIKYMPSFGDRTAMRYRTEYRGYSWSYSKLHDSILRMAGVLRDHGIHPGDRVMLWAPNSPGWVITFLGCLLAGGVVVPIDLGARPPFVRDVARETRARLLVRTRFKADAEISIPTVFSEDLPDLLGHRALNHPALPRPVGTDMAEVVYTSGTLARPKGVVLTHGNLAAALSSIGPVVPPEPEYRFLVVLPLSHIFGQVIDLLLPFSRGATIVLLETLKPSAIATALQREAITVLPAVPRLLELLRGQILGMTAAGVLGEEILGPLLATAPRLPFEWRRWLFWTVHRGLGADLKYLVSGGAALDPGLAQFWDRLGFFVLQGYGLTETASAIACERIDARRIGSVGKVLPGQEVRVGLRGELLVRGPNVTPGYYANPTATAAAFQHGAWFRTGDVGYFDADDFLYIKDRLKEVIVTSAGVNVYPWDVEAVLAKQPGVRDSVVVEWQAVVHAVLLLEPGADSRRVVADANRNLDSAQQVQAYTIWPFADFPRGPTLKPRKRDVLEFLARHQLPEESTQGVRGPATRLQALFAQLRQQPAAQLHPDATLGLDLKLGSIDRLELVSLIEQELNVDLADEDVTSQTTEGELERMIQERRLPERPTYSRWARSPAARVLRDVLQHWLVFPVLGRLIRLRVLGRQHLSTLEEGCIFAANHQSYLDAAVIAMALPAGLRRHIAVAAWAEYFEAAGCSWPVRLLRNLEWCAAALAVNAFRLPQRRIFRSSMQYMGELAEEGENVLIFPEGRRTFTGEIGSFHEGIGLIATALRVPVVPIRLDGLYDLIYRNRLIPRSGEVAVRFGPPLTFSENETYQDIASRVEEVVRLL